MRSASPQYEQEEKRTLFARPRLKAVFRPFKLEPGLKEGEGVFSNTLCGGTAANLFMQSGYLTSGCWEGPIKQAYNGRMNFFRPAWTDKIGYLHSNVQYRTATEYSDLGEAPWMQLVCGEEADLQKYFQFKITFADPVRAWALDNPEQADDWAAYGIDGGSDICQSYAADGNFPGGIEDLKLEGGLTIHDNEIIRGGVIKTGIALDFADIVAGSHELVLDNRDKQWNPLAPNFYFSQALWYDKQVSFFSGYELPSGQVGWQELYMGQVQKLTVAHSHYHYHTAEIRSNDLICSLLKRKIGAPGGDGIRKPFLRGYYVLNADWQSTERPFAGAAAKTGAGSAAISTIDSDYYNNSVDTFYRLKIETAGEVGTATFSWSKDGGCTWEKSGLSTANQAAPLHLENNLYVYWTAGSGNDFEEGDYWDFVGYVRRNHYLLPGAPFQDITAVYADGERIDRYTADLATGKLVIQGPGRSHRARIVKDDITHPADIIKDIITEVGLADRLRLTDYQVCKSVTAGYNIGVCFENVNALSAIQKICANCLYELWIEAGEIRMQAYLGESG
ncbi:hypothetical protein [Desulfobacca acetoxidans]|uniref:Uncharacterized protein n=1 Tax=Desulfobacca acetoxidans (strain ATCC 700848 / DSM 11109 / ASRB2) TaxID=880072 RepID=F2NCR6_DESAR|nr:hypothetical protein [Desulfobacca acetoxidans]AEB09347.1 hypothetical protein Desac_1492 [Desulfobacca acetoxidans DSM 11109]